MKPFIASHLKDLNRRTVFDLIAEVGEIPRTEITKLTGISAPTVLKITNFLCESGLIFAAGEGESALGRKPQLLRFNPNFAYSIGVEYEGDYLKIGIVNVNNEIVVKKTIHVKSDFENVITCVLIDNVKDLINESQIPRNKIIGLGIGLPGAVNLDNDELKLSPLVGVNDKYSLQDIIEKMQQALNIPVYICNDVNAATTGEYIKRKLKDEDFVYISLGTGLGSGIILDGQLRLGKQYIAGEIGYMVYEADFQISENKPGLLESLINLRALSLKFEDFENRVKNKTNIKEIVEYVASYLGRTIVNIISVLDVSRVVLGGIIVDMLGEDLLEEVSKQVRKLSSFNVCIDMRTCDEPGIIGTACLINRQHIDKIFLSEE